MAMPVHLLIVDEHAQVRLALAERLLRVPQAIVLGAVSDVASAVPLVRNLHPDVVLYEPKTARQRQHDDLAPLLAAGSPVVVWTSWLDDDEAQAFLRAGARDVLLKDTNILALIERLAAIAA
jgi:NarL family two-component system response regulator YdfI